MTGAGALALGTLLSGCNRQDQTALTVRLLKNSIPAPLVGAFQNSLRGQQVNLDFKPEPQLQALFTLLQAWKQPSNQPIPQRWADRDSLFKPSRDRDSCRSRHLR